MVLPTGFQCRTSILKQYMSMGVTLREKKSLSLQLIATIPFPTMISSLYSSPPTVVHGGTTKPTTPVHSVNGNDDDKNDNNGEDSLPGGISTPVTTFGSNTSFSLYSLDPPPLWCGVAAPAMTCQRPHQHEPEWPHCVPPTTSVSISAATPTHQVLYATPPNSTQKKRLQSAPPVYSFEELEHARTRVFQPRLLHPTPPSSPPSPPPLQQPHFTSSLNSIRPMRLHLGSPSTSCFLPILRRCHGGGDPAKKMMPAPNRKDDTHHHYATFLMRTPIQGYTTVAATTTTTTHVRRVFESVTTDLNGTNQDHHHHPRHQSDFDDHGFLDYGQYSSTQFHQISPSMPLLQDDDDDGNETEPKSTHVPPTIKMLCTNKLLHRMFPFSTVTKE